MMQDDLTHDNFDFRGFSKENRHETELIRDEEERSSKKPANPGLKISSWSTARTSAQLKITLILIQN